MRKVYRRIGRRTDGQMDRRQEKNKQTKKPCVLIKRVNVRKREMNLLIVKRTR